MTLGSDVYFLIGDNRGMPMKNHDFGKARRADRIIGRYSFSMANSRVSLGTVVLSLVTALVVAALSSTCSGQTRNGLSGPG